MSRFCICVLTAVLIALAPALPTGAQTQTSLFLVKPYVQLGNNPDHSNKLEILWFSQKKSGFKLFFREADSAANTPWKQSENLRITLQPTSQIKHYYRYSGSIESSAPGREVEYRVDFAKKTLFKKVVTSRKSKEQSYTFALAGDVGAGSFGQKGNTFQIHKLKPDLYLIPGDIAYNRGKVEDYLLRFFPFLNSESAAVNRGAPLLAETITATAIGNHDIALTNQWTGVDFTSYPDALGYYRFWSQPLNGPKRRVNERNTTIIRGDARAQLNFVKAAGERFPRMANYSFDFGNSHWLVIDANPYMNWTDQEMRNWVEKDLRTTKAAWKFVLCHQPGFSIDNNHWVEQRMRLLSQIFEQCGVDIVFSGHAHTYQRSYPLKFTPRETANTNVDGTVSGDFILDRDFDGARVTRPRGVLYIVSGAGGASLYRKGLLPVSETLFNFKFLNQKHSFTFCKVEDDNIELRQIDCDGEEIDRIRITK